MSRGVFFFHSPALDRPCGDTLLLPLIFDGQFRVTQRLRPAVRSVVCGLPQPTAHPERPPSTSAVPPCGLSEFSCLAGAKPGCQLEYIFAISAHIFFFLQFVRIFHFSSCSIFSAKTMKKHSSLYRESMVYCIRNLLIQRIRIVYNQRS